MKILNISVIIGIAFSAHAANNFCTVQDEPGSL